MNSNDHHKVLALMHFLVGKDLNDTVVFLPHFLPFFLPSFPPSLFPSFPPSFLPSSQDFTPKAPLN